MLDDLYRRACQGDEGAETQLLKYLFERFLRIMRHNYRNRIDDQDAQDIAQEACITVSKKYKTEQFTKNFSSWSYGVLKNKIRNYLGEPKPPVIIDMPSTHPIDYDLRKKLLVCFRQVMKRNIYYARALNLSYQGYKACEIAQKLKIKINNLYVILNRGRTMLDLCLKKGKI